MESQEADYDPAHSVLALLLPHVVCLCETEAKEEQDGELGPQFKSIVRHQVVRSHGADHCDAED